MLYYKCPTCRSLLANKQIPFQNGMRQICDNTFLDENQKKKEKQKLLDDLLITNICCRMRILTFIPLIDLVK